ncbi:hypothetical protein [Sphingomonas yantingensis]|jgi:integrase|uniref:Integrase n=2 Tax=Sphingomonas TaxID=13687 RepID=A0A7W9AT08_9SPHN|nr:hypothetical protein [Sphingomonas yantingensis]MBB5699892.1 integrase [Sphingomonas yantingensis]
MPESDVANGLIVLTDATCMIKEKRYPGIPTLVWNDGIDEDASDWFRDLVVRDGLAISSVEEYANILRPFLRFCRSRRRNWRTVDDDFLLVWREELHRGQSVGIPRVNTSLDVIFSFYQWAEEKRRIRYHVGIYTDDEIPAQIREHGFSITAKRTFRKTRHGKVFASWSTKLKLAGARQSSRLRHTPTEDETRRAHEVIAEQPLGERDSLMFSWAEEVGTRRSEILQVRKSHMPTQSELEKLIDLGEDWCIELKRKGGKTKPIYVSPDLVIRTMDFIEVGRADIVSLCKAKIVDYHEPDEVFISTRTGLVLHPDSVTSLGAKAFNSAGITNANIHRLRARKAVEVVETLVEAVFSGEMIGSQTSWIETILTLAAERMGHMSPESLRPYLNYVLKRRIEKSDANAVAKLKTKRRQLEAHVGTLARRLSQHCELHRAARLIADLRNEEAASALRRIADELLLGA